jgi:hypothetical protein
VSSTQIDLSWTAATDNVAVTGYRVERCTGSGCSSFVEIGSTGATSFSDSGRNPSTSYSYRVRATDAVPNLGPYTSTASATTPGAAAGLVAAYSFNEGAGATVGDASGTGNAGTVSGTTWATTGKFGRALAFNGTTSSVTVPDAASIDLTSAVTLEAWVNPSTVTRALREVIFKGSDNYYLEATTNRNPAVPAGGGTIGGSNIRLLGATSLPVNTWTHLAFTYNGAMMRLYVNGVQVSTRARTGAVLTSTNPLRIGRAESGRYFAGLIDEVRIYNVARSAAQVQADMATPIVSSSLFALSATPRFVMFSACGHFPGHVAHRQVWSVSAGSRARWTPFPGRRHWYAPTSNAGDSATCA